MGVDKMSLHKKIAKKYIQSKSKFNDLGDSKLCGIDLVESRIPPAKFDDYSSVIRRILNQNGRVEENIERDIYPASRDADFNFKYTHKMKLEDKSYWGKKRPLKVSVRLTSHAQMRMDQRCVSKDDIQKAITNLLDEIQKAWISKEFRRYSDLVKHILVGSGANKYDTHVDGDLIRIVLAPPVRDYEEINGLKVPSSNSIFLNVVSVMSTRTKKVEDTPDQIQCLETLKSMGYSVRTKKASYFKRANLDQVKIDMNIKNEDDSKWNGFGFFTVWLTTGSNLTIPLNEIKKGLRKWTEANLVEPWSRGDFDTYNSNMTKFNQGIKINAGQYALDLEPSFEGKPFQSKMFEYMNGNQPVIAPKRNKSDGGLVFLEVTNVQEEITEDFLEDQKKIVNRCLLMIPERYEVFDPQGKKVSF